MACPFFMPIEKLETGAWPHASRLPLAGGWSGHCTAPGHDGEIPALLVLEKSCNLGYSADCDWLPRDRRFDAVRFAVSARRKEPSTIGRTLRVKYVCERGNRPVEHGMLDFDIITSTWTQPHGDARIQKMAECFLSTYLAKQQSALADQAERSDQTLPSEALQQEDEL